MRAAHNLKGHRAVNLLTEAKSHFGSDIVSESPWRPS